MGSEHRVTDFDSYLFVQGNHYQIYEKFGAHPAKEDGREGVYFAVWAPNAKAVSVVGDFNNWDAAASPMTKSFESGIWDCFIPDLGVGTLYKYSVTGYYGETVLKADPYGNQMELRPGSASIVADLNGFAWQDKPWIESHRDSHAQKPMAIYEVHPGSWRKDPDQPGGFYNWRRLAKELAAYVKDMGYTHVELMGVSEHPFDGSWGYQVSGYYAPTARYGTPNDFMFFVDYMHRHGIGVIVDWVPAHFPRDLFCLGRFDGTALYEHEDPRRGEHPDWGTYCFNFGRPEVANFLIANAFYWVEKYHIDGLRTDAVASMLYLDFGRKAGEWIPNKDGGNKDYEAVAFLQKLNTEMEKKHPGVYMIAEESTAWPMITGDPKDGGLGFTHKWNMGWMHDFLEYQQCDPYFRKFNHNMITFSFTYAYSEKFILAISHDEVVHLKKSMIYKMHGTMPEKFGNLRVAYGLMMMHPGKKLLFMGQEFAQIREWSEERSLDWDLLEQPEHLQMQRYFKDLLHFYRRERALYALDDYPEGFAWINGADADHNMLTICRLTKTGKGCLLCHFNFSPVTYDTWRSGVLCPGTYTEIFNSNAEIYGGNGIVNDKPIKAEKVACDFKDYSITYKLGAYGMCVFKFDMKIPRKK